MGRQWKSVREYNMPSELYKLGPVRGGINKSGRTPDGRILTQLVSPSRKVVETPRRASSSKDEEVMYCRDSWEEEDFPFRRDQDYLKKSRSDVWELPYPRPIWREKRTALKKFPEKGIKHLNRLPYTKESNNLSKSVKVHKDLKLKTPYSCTTSTEEMNGCRFKSEKEKKMRELSKVVNVQNKFRSISERQIANKKVESEGSYCGLINDRSPKHLKSQKIPMKYRGYLSSSSNSLPDVYDTGNEQFVYEYVEGSKNYKQSHKNLRKIARKVFHEYEAARKIANEVIEKDRRYGLKKCNELVKDNCKIFNRSYMDSSRCESLYYKTSKGSKLSSDEVEALFTSEPVSVSKGSDMYYRGDKLSNQKNNRSFQTEKRWTSGRRSSFDNESVCCHSSVESATPEKLIIPPKTGQYKKIRSVLNEVRSSSRSNIKSSVETRKRALSYSANMEFRQSLNSQEERWRMAENDNVCSSASKQHPIDKKSKSGSAKIKRNIFPVQAPTSKASGNSDKLKYKEGKIPDVSNIILEEKEVDLPNHLLNDPEVLCQIDKQIEEESFCVSKRGHFVSEDKAIQINGRGPKACLSNRSLEDDRRKKSSGLLQSVCELNYSSLSSVLKTSDKVVEDIKTPALNEEEFSSALAASGSNTSTLLDALAELKDNVANTAVINNMEVVEQENTSDTKSTFNSTIEKAKTASEGTSSNILLIQPQATVYKVTPDISTSSLLTEIDTSAQDLSSENAVFEYSVEHSHNESLRNKKLLTAQFCAVSDGPASLQFARTAPSVLPSCNNSLISQRGYRGCRRCRNHGYEVRYSYDHKCPNKECDCKKCRNLKQKAIRVRRVMPALTEEVQKAPEQPRSDFTPNNHVLPVVRKYFPEVLEAAEMNMNDALTSNSTAVVDLKTFLTPLYFGGICNTSDNLEVSWSPPKGDRIPPATCGVQSEPKPIRIRFDEQRTLNKVIEYIDLTSENEDCDDGLYLNSLFGTVIKEPASPEKNLLTCSNSSSHVCTPKESIETKRIPQEKQVPQTGNQGNANESISSEPRQNVQQQRIPTERHPNPTLPSSFGSSQSPQRLSEQPGIQTYNYPINNFSAQPAQYRSQFFNQITPIDYHYQPSIITQRQYQINSFSPWPTNVQDCRTTSSGYYPQVVTQGQLWFPQNYSGGYPFAQFQQSPGINFTSQSGAMAYSDMDNVFQI